MTAKNKKNKFKSSPNWREVDPNKVSSFAAVPQWMVGGTVIAAIAALLVRAGLVPTNAMTIIPALVALVSMLAVVAVMAASGSAVPVAPEA
jgi:hypothetical protein